MRGRAAVPRGLLLVAALATSGALAVGGCGGSDSSTVETKDPEAAFAPLVRLDPEERWRPMGARWFINRAALWFANGGSCEDGKISVGRKLEAQRTEVTDWLFTNGLGRGPWYGRYPRSRTCDDYRLGTDYFTNQHNRPFDTEDRPKGLRRDEGYYMDLMDWAREGPRLREDDDQAVVGDVPAYVERRAERVGGGPGLRLTYWMLYGMNEPLGEGPAAQERTHEGDWERIDVLVRRGDGKDEYEPVALRLYADGRARRDVRWESIDREGSGDESHPVVRSARGDHTPAPGDGSCEDCPEWETWKALMEGPEQRWYGFGGAWGELGYTGPTSGPLGPHRKWGRGRADLERLSRSGGS